MNREGLMQPLFYLEIMKRLAELYGVTYEQEHELVHEFFEGPIPLFKLMLTQTSEGPGVMLVSFHLELDSTSAIQWYMRIRKLDPNLHITSCYLKDAEGTSYVGEDAYILRMYMIEQDTISAFVASNKDVADVLNSSAAVVHPKPSPVKTYSDYRKAFTAFQSLDKKPGDIEH